ncbi:MAG: carbohydrate ABC transporter substrate-binding protein [Clostridia bacterium]|nr:carbohydrate ABC transporter substrate-binding protein [Clostridia bacterium]
MKRLWLRWLAMTLCMCVLTGAAQAADATVMAQRDSDEAIRVTRDVLSVGDAAYFSIYTDDGGEIWYWQEEMTRAERLASGLTFTNNYNSIEHALQKAEEARASGAAQVPDVVHAVAEIVSDGEKLYGINDLNGLVFTIRIENGEILYDDVVTLKDVSPMYHGYDDASWYWSPLNVCVADHQLLWHTRYEKRDGTDGYTYCLMIWDLKDGSLRKAPIDEPQAVAAYRDGQVLVLTQKPDEKYDYVVNVYNPSTDEMTAVGEITGRTSSLRRIVYSPRADALLYQDGNRIMGMEAFGEAVQYAYMPGTNGTGLAVVGDSIVVDYSSWTAARTLTKGYTAEDCVRTFNAPIGTGRAFSEEYPAIPVFGADDYALEDADADAYVEYMTNGTEIPDVARLGYNSGLFDQLVDSGVMRDLSGNEEIAAYVNALYPAYRELVSRDGAIYAVPTMTSSYGGFYINKKVMQDMGLTEADIPANLADLCAFAERWNDEYAALYPHYTLLEYTEDYRERIFHLMLEGWYGYCQANDQPLHFDDPVFRTMLKALDDMNIRELDASMQTENPEVSDYKQGLIWDHCQLVGNFASYMEDYSDRVFLPMTLTAQTPFAAKVDNVTLWYVNAQSAHVEYAEAFIEKQIELITDKFRRVLLSTCVEPVENRGYAELLATENEKLAAMEAQKDSVNPVTAKLLEAAIQSQRAYMEKEVEKSRYTITPSAIENYVKVIAPAVYMYVPNELEKDETLMVLMTSLCHAYVDREITMEAFISGAEAILTKAE